MKIVCSLVVNSMFYVTNNVVFAGKNLSSAADMILLALVPTALSGTHTKLVI